MIKLIKTNKNKIKPGSKSHTVYTSYKYNMKYEQTKHIIVNYSASSIFGANRKTIEVHTELNIQDAQYNK